MTCPAVSTKNKIGSVHYSSYGVQVTNNDTSLASRCYLKSSYYSMSAADNSIGLPVLFLNGGRLSNPSTCFFAFDSTNTKENTGIQMSSYCIDGWGTDKALLHDGRANLHFADSHVETVTAAGWAGIIHENRTDYTSNHLYAYDNTKTDNYWWNISGL